MSADTEGDATDRYRVGSLEEVEAQPQVVDVRGEKYLVCVVGDETYAYRNVCPHQGGPVAEGRVDTENGRVVCPWHGWPRDRGGGIVAGGNDELRGRSRRVAAAQPAERLAGFGERREQPGR
jgi:nitrite reductase (NADH) small subunit